MENLNCISLNPVLLSNSRISKYRESLLILEPNSLNHQFQYNEETYTIVGKHWKTKKRYLAQKLNDSLFYECTLVHTQESTTQELELNLDITILGDIQFDPNRFNPTKANTAMDFIFSNQGGIMPSTNYIIIGDPGIGKSTVSIDYAANVQLNNPEKRVLFVSGEMTAVDLYEYIERFPTWKSLNTCFVSKFTNGLYKKTIESYFKMGWDLVVIDSFAEICSSVLQDELDLGNRASYSTIESWLIDLFIENNDGLNDLNKWTSFVSIQQVTKGGTFVGSNKLKHNTTGMIELRYTKTGEKTIQVSKNRRGNFYNDLHFSFTESGIKYDTERIEREMELQQKILAEKDEILSDERKFKELFGLDQEEELVLETV